MGDGARPDPSMAVALIPIAAPTADGRDAVEMAAVLAFSDESPSEIGPGEAIPAGDRLAELSLGDGESRFRVVVERPGAFALFTEHLPEEFSAFLTGPDGPIDPVFPREYKPDHEHDEEVSSVGIEIPGDLDSRKLNRWMGTLLQEKGVDLFRTKGVLSIAGDANRYVFQGVHMLLDGRPDRPWDAEPRKNKMIFIGRNLDREALVEGFRSCLA